MSIFTKGEPLAGADRPRFKIKLTAEDGGVYYWHKRGRLHTVEEDVANVFVSNFNRSLFQVRSDGTLTPPQPGETFPIRSVEKEPA